MFKIPYSELLAIIKQKSSLSEFDIENKVQQKMRQLSGLISKEGAAHIIANELGIKLFDQFSGKIQIKNILSGMRNVETAGRVLKIYETKEFITNERSGKVASLVIGDQTGYIRVVLWGSQADLVKQMTENMIVKIVSGYVRDNNGNLEIHMNDRAKLILNPPGEDVPEVNIFIPIARKKISELSENDNNVEIVGTIVRVFEPRFFEICPKCGKRARIRDNAFYCDEHNKIEPRYSSAINIFLDDGSDNIRAVFFGNQALKLINKDSTKLMEYKENPEKFEDIKNELLGNSIKISGRVNKNGLFDRLEFISNDIDTSPNPDEEIKRLNEEIAKVSKE